MATANAFEDEDGNIVLTVRFSRLEAEALSYNQNALAPAERNALYDKYSGEKHDDNAKPNYWPVTKCAWDALKAVVGEGSRNAFLTYTKSKCGWRLVPDSE